MGQLWKSTLPDNTSITNEFYLTGQLKRTYGSRTYPVGYGYDAQGRQTIMTNWTSFAAQTGTRITTWNYDTNRGFLTSKVYDGSSQGTTYTYTGAGRLHTRLWARGTSTTYAYNGAGDLSTVICNDGVTPGTTNGYDRMGRVTIVSNAPTVCTLTYNNANQLLSESYSGGPLNGISITNGYDSLLRRTNNVTLLSGVVMTTITNNFDTASRLQTISDGINSATYSYLANSPLVSQIDFKQSGAARMTTTKSYDNLNRLSGITNVNASLAVLDSHNYAYNSANQRTQITNTDNSDWVYQYDSLGQVTSGKKYWSDGTPAAGEQFGYGFDDIGNRQTTAAGGDQFGANLRYASYSANSLNQYTSRTVPGAVDVIGTATNTATITVNNTPTSRKGMYYRAQLPVNNSSGPVSQSVTNLAVLNQGTSADIVTNTTGSLLVPPASQTFSYDLDGNLTGDSVWNYVWDGENRLIQMSSVSALPTAAQKKLDFVYDYRGRRVQKIISTNNGSAWVTASTNRFVCDGWNVVAELNGANNALLRSYIWGTDVSGSLQGAGGVGGLLRVAYAGASVTNSFVAYDGNGNVLELVSAMDGSINAQYEYGPFGEVIRATGPMAKLNPFRFSTKYQDDETDLMYYGYRYLKTSSGGWINRDPIEEKGGNNLYCFVANCPIRYWDLNGLDFSTWCGFGPCYGNLGGPGPGCTPSYSSDDLEWWESKLAYPSGTKWGLSMSQIKQDILNRIKGGCCCFQNVYFSEHNGTPGTLVFPGGDVVNPQILQMLQNAANLRELPKVFAKKHGAGLLQQDVDCRHCCNKLWNFT
ncbi:MAG: type secretion protein Rhs [Pedosphaera sp.]|nr:type secretion protein Rhs [Pedosphaera sp.]